MHYLKHEEGGVNAVCEIMRKYSEEVAEKAYQQGEDAGKEIGKEIRHRRTPVRIQITEKHNET